MILSEQILMLVRNILVTAGITAYSDYIPDETDYPFCMYEILDLENYPDWAFEKDYERHTVRFNIYGNKDNPLDIIVIAEQIETLLDRTKNVFVESEGGIYLVCNYKVNDNISIENESEKWLVISDYEFVCQRNINEDADSSSSGS